MAIVMGINGGSGGTVFNDFNDIIDINRYPGFGGGGNIENIDIKSVQIRHGGLVDGLQFTYTVVTKDGASYPYQGNRYGERGGDLDELNLRPNEKISVITVIYGRDATFSPNNTVVKHIKFQTTIQTFTYGGEVAAGDPQFKLYLSPEIGSSSLVFGSTIDKFVGSIGTIDIKPPSTATSSPSTASNNNVSSTSSSELVALSCTTGILGLYFLVTMGIFLRILWRKLHKPIILIPGQSLIA